MRKLSLLLAIVLLLLCTACSGGEYPDEVVYRGGLASRFLGMTMDEATKELGKNNTEVSDHDGGLYGGNCTVYFDSNGKVNHIVHYYDECKVNGKTIPKTLDTSAIEKHFKGIKFNSGNYKDGRYIDGTYIERYSEPETYSYYFKENNKWTRFNYSNYVIEFETNQSDIIQNIHIFPK